ncbi:MAG: thiamine-monophosphate kinase [Deltaproteobacteria bacterium]|nr:thiamine-monophosphate kinase [Deltaproteobacteria bacterium]
MTGADRSEGEPQGRDGDDSRRSDEFARIDRIARILSTDGRTDGGAGASARADVIIGIGDDAAVLAPIGERTVLTVDAAVEDVHFRRAWMSFEDIGFRATVAAASDVLAMGARPTVAVAAWTVPASLTEDAIDAIARGQREAADALGLAIVGGNLSSGPALSITTTVLGVAAAPVGRAGARAGDRVVVAGALGEAALGLLALSQGRADAAPRAVAAFRRPPVLLEASTHLARVAHAAVDVSDGLAQDVGHLAKASGLRAVIDLAAVRARRRPANEAAARALGLDPERRAPRPPASVTERDDRDHRRRPLVRGHRGGGPRGRSTPDAGRRALRAGGRPRDPGAPAAARPRRDP